MTRAGLVALVFSASLLGQGRTPVVLLNGYQASCPAATDSTSVFGKLQTLLEAQGVTVWFFDSCSLPGSSRSRPTIEELGQAFGNYLENIPAPQVDVVTHSMGGLIVRSYLAGMLPSGRFAPPENTRLRKAVMIAAPHYGALALLYYLLPVTVDAQLEELLPGSSFEWRLNTSNQGSYDFRGVDTLAIVGNGAGTSDGVVPLTSASLAGFFQPERTRVIAGCHVPDMPQSICSGDGIAHIDSTAQDSWKLIDSFLSGTAAWSKTGLSASDDTVLSRFGGINVAVSDSNGNVSKSITRVVAPQGELPGNGVSGVFFGDLLPIADYSFSVSGGGSALPNTFAVRPSAGFHKCVLVKNGPRVDAVASATGSLPGLSRAPGMLVSIYGFGLEGATFTAGGQPVSVLYESDSQVNAVLPERLSGVVPFVATSSGGSHTVNLFVEDVVPALFQADASGLVLAFHSDGTPVDTANPASPDETIALYATGLNHALNLQAFVGAYICTIAETAEVSPGITRVALIIPPDSPLGASIPLTIAVGTRQASASISIASLQQASANP